MIFIDIFHIFWLAKGHHGHRGATKRRLTTRAPLSGRPWLAHFKWKPSPTIWATVDFQTVAALSSSVFDAILHEIHRCVSILVRATASEFAAPETQRNTPNGPNSPRRSRLNFTWWRFAFSTRRIRCRRPRSPMPAPRAWPRGRAKCSKSRYWGLSTTQPWTTLSGKSCPTWTHARRER